MKKNIPFHPWLLALIPILSLFEHNQDVADIHYLYSPIITALVCTTFFFFILNLFIKNKFKTAIISSALIISFFFFDYLSSMFLGINYIIPYKIMPNDALAFVVYLITFLGFSFLIVNSKKKLNKLNKLLNFFAFTIIILQLFNILNYQYKQILHDSEEVISNAKIIKNANITTKNTLPDIYYIILDGYGRQDVLQNIYNYDNSSFIEFLKNKGFYVAAKSNSNYNQTFLSLSSSLNINYLDDIANKVGYNSNDRSILKKILKDNFVYKLLKEKGYTFVSLPSTWSGTYKNIKSDIHLMNDLKQNNFDIMLIKKTPISLFVPRLQTKILATNTNGVLDKIIEIADIKEPTFSYTHILSPHPPFIFDSNGNVIDETMNCIGAKDGSHYFKTCPGVKKYKKKYIDQLSYINTRIKSIIDELLENYETPPIIILQADHGPGSMLDWDSLENSNIHERAGILNAYYVPEETKKMLYQNISPVNSFRVIFNSLFNNEFKILEDKTYFTLWDKPYKFIDINNQLQ